MELERARVIAREVVYWLTPACSRITVAGSIRRQKPQVNDIEILCIPRVVNGIDQLDRQIKLLISQGELDYRLNRLGRRVYGPKNKLMVHLPSGMAVDIFSTTEENWGMALFVRTGPREWNIRAMSRFRSLGMLGHAYGGISRLDGSLINCPDEETVFRYLGWAYLPPERRA